MDLYGHPFSSYTWKALIPAYALGIDFTFYQLAEDGSGADWDFVRRVHPAGKFPVLVDGATIVIEATAIVEYLAASFDPGASLIPADPADAVQVRMLDRVFDNYVMANMQQVVDAHLANPDAPNQAQLEAGKSQLLRTYRWLEEWLGRNALSPHVSLVTCAAAPALFYADWVEPIPQACARLAQLRADLLALPSVARCIDDARPWRKFFPPGAPDRD